MEPIRYHDLGDGPPLLLIHGSFSNGQLTWGAQMRHLADRHRLIVVDRRGHGTSPREPRPYTIGGDAVDVFAAADRAGVSQFHLVGHSYGGLVAIEVARRAPQRLRSLHLVEPPYLALEPRDPDVRDLDEAGRAIQRSAGTWDAERLATAFFDMLLGPTEAAELRAHRAWPLLVAEASRFADEEYAADYPASALRDLRIDCPVRVYSGGQSHVALQKVANTLAARLPGADLVVVPEATHIVQRWAEPFNQALLEITEVDATLPRCRRAGL